MANRDRFGHVIPTIEDEIMAHFDTQIRGDFGNTPAILEEASKDLAADNAAAAQTDYGRRCISHHHACDCREAAFKAQIERLIARGHNAWDTPELFELWVKEVKSARELIK